MLKLYRIFFLVIIYLFVYNSCKNPDSKLDTLQTCLLYTSDAADERSSVDLGGRRIIKKKKKE